MPASRESQRCYPPELPQVASRPAVALERDEL
jgi:hypothetical protein